MLQSNSTAILQATSTHQVNDVEGRTDDDISFLQCGSILPNLEYDPAKDPAFTPFIPPLEIIVRLRTRSLTAPDPATDPDLDPATDPAPTSVPLLSPAHAPVSVLPELEIVKDDVRCRKILYRRLSGPLTMETAARREDMIHRRASCGLLLESREGESLHTNPTDESFSGSSAEEEAFLHEVSKDVVKSLLKHRRTRMSLFQYRQKNVSLHLLRARGCLA